MSPFEHGEVFVLDDGGEVNCLINRSNIACCCFNFCGFLVLSIVFFRCGWCPNFSGNREWLWLAFFVFEGGPWPWKLWAVSRSHFDLRQQYYNWKNLSGYLTPSFRFVEPCLTFGYNWRNHVSYVCQTTCFIFNSSLGCFNSMLLTKSEGEIILDRLSR